MISTTGDLITFVLRVSGINGVGQTLTLVHAYAVVFPSP